MRNFAKHIALIATATAVAAALAPASPAVASTGIDTIHGGCGFDTETPTQVSNTARGIMFDASVTFDATGAPTDATVTCAIAINGVIDPDTELIASGFGEQAGATQISFEDDPGNSVVLCQRVQFADGYDTGMSCIFEPPPPLPLIEIVDFIVATETQLFVDDIDPVACPVFVALAGDYGPVSIKPDGDVYVTDPLDSFAGGPAYDCPPYGNF